MQKTQKTLSRDDPLLWFARRLCAILDKPLINPSALPSSGLAVDSAVTAAAELQRTRRLLDRASARNWTLSAQRLAERLAPLCARLRDAAGAAVVELGRGSTWIRPAVGEIHEELLALSEEFGPPHLDRRARVLGVVTERVILNDLDLGPFRIELRLAKLADDRHVAGAIACIAMEPNPPACSATTTHPHVRDGQPCLGEASATVSAALLDGRILDAFLAVAAVLRTYNSSSPYVALEDWSGVSCDDCGRYSGGDDHSTCASCQNRLCDSCSSYCDACNDNYCRGCLESTEDDRELCSACRGRCDDCDEVVERSILEDGVCPSCRERQEEEEIAEADAPAGVGPLDQVEPVPAAYPPCGARAEAPRLGSGLAVAH